MHQILASIGARKRLAITLIAALAATLFAIQIAGSASAATKHRIPASRTRVRTAKARPRASASSAACCRATS